MAQLVPALGHAQEPFRGGCDHLLQATGQHVTAESHLVGVLPGAADEPEQPLRLFEIRHLAGGAPGDLGQHAGLPDRLPVQ
ncbi:hypothetical protein ACFFX0_00975 [Citricoccus parietis]|uniref:Uncharacterized protein n=1 Tax=Citricoccus parietis TaxID=592307 RepID=A0ABV5FT50_9MICC